MLKLLSSKNMLIGFAFVLAATNSATVYFTSSYKDGQHAKIELALVKKEEEARNKLISEVGKRLKAEAQVKALQAQKNRVIEKEVIRYVETTITNQRVVECFDNDGLSVIRQIATGDANTGKPVGKAPVKFAGPDQREEYGYYADAQAVGGDVSFMLF